MSSGPQHAMTGWVCQDYPGLSSDGERLTINLGCNSTIVKRIVTGDTFATWLVEAGKFVGRTLGRPCPMDISSERRAKPYQFLLCVLSPISYDRGIRQYAG